MEISEVLVKFDKLSVAGSQNLKKNCQYLIVFIDKSYAG